ncbi:MAG TPA: hypothetical protein PKA64_25010, partial [Myxococcota bacterium]|nr:hypothetical protein [Myxococcota bacterium]
MSEPAAPVLDVLLRELRGAPVSLPPPPPGVPWERALERALASADREVRWRIGPAAEVAAEAEPGLPA